MTAQAAETLDAARRWGDAMNGIGNSTIVRAMLPRGQADQLMRVDRLDGIGPARYGELEQIGEATIEVIGR